ncbi:MAG: hypothetical protein H6642_18575 [Caldilineaceae bacterium]|nr:hypothetical protein [Caldilineaceae bacterium]
MNSKTMNVKYLSVLALILVLLMATSVTVFAQDALPTGVPPQDGTGFQWGGNSGAAAGAANYVDLDGDGVCDNFIDADGDGVCDNCTQSGVNQSGPMRRGGQR